MAKKTEKAASKSAPVKVDPVEEEARREAIAAVHAASDEK